MLRQIIHASYSLAFGGMVVLFATAAAFTTVGTGDSSVDKDTINELRQAQRERGQVSGMPGVWTPTNFVGGEVAHDQDDWGDNSGPLVGYQTNLVSMIPYFVNHTIAATNTNTVVMWTVPAWQSETGLTNSGYFRRLTNAAEIASGTTNWLYGIAQVGDIVGAWLWEDLQTGYSALKWTVDDGANIATKQKRAVFLASNADCATAKASHDSQWAADVYTNTFAQDMIYRASASYVTNANHQFASRRDRGICEFTGLPTNIAHTAQLVGLPTVSAGEVFADIDGLGMTTSNLYIVAEFTSATTNARTMTNYMAGVDWDTSPLDAYGIDCGSATNEYDIRIDEADAYLILKWVFSNSN